MSYKNILLLVFAFLLFAADATEASAQYYGRRSSGFFEAMFGPVPRRRRQTRAPSANPGPAAASVSKPGTEAVKKTIKEKLEIGDMVIVKNQSHQSKVMEILPDGMVKVKNLHKNTEYVAKDGDLARTKGCFAVCVGEEVEDKYQSAKLAVLGVFPSGAVQAGLNTMPEGEAGDNPLSFFLAPDEIGKTKGCSKNNICVGQKVTVPGYPGAFTMRSLFAKNEVKVGQGENNLTFTVDASKLTKMEEPKKAVDEGERFEDPRELEQRRLNKSVADSTQMLEQVASSLDPMECIEEGQPNRSPAGGPSEIYDTSELEAALKQRDFDKRVIAARAAAVKNGVAASAGHWNILLNAKPYQTRSEALGTALDAKRIPEDAKAAIREQCKEQTEDEVKALCRKLRDKFSF